MTAQKPHQARKRFGQNFLIDQNIIDKIVMAIHPQRGENVVEIGPGFGALTNHLLPHLDRLHVVEIDRDLVAELKALHIKDPSLLIHNKDALKFDFSTLATEKPIRVIGNLPYNISTPLLFHLFSYSQKIADMHFMLQNEVVDRLAAKPGSSDYGRLSVMAQYYSDVVKLFTVKPASFQPAPKVDSAIVRLIIRPPAIQASNEKYFATIVKQAFAQRRKTLKNNLKGWLEVEMIEQCAIDANARAETLCVDDFIKLSNISYAPPQ